MAQSFISELGDRLGGDGVANTEGEHVKTISAEYYKRNDSGTVSNQSLQSAIDGKINKAEACGGVNLLSYTLGGSSSFDLTQADPTSNDSSSATFVGTTSTDSYILGRLLESVRKNEIVTLSFDISGLTNNEYIDFMPYDLDTTYDHFINANGHFVYTIVSSRTINAGRNASIFDDVGSSFYNTAPHGFTVSNIKLERGRIATQYTRHPSEMNVYGASNAVHLTGNETITGKKLFSNNLPTLYAEHLLLFRKFLFGHYGIPYEQWDSSQKDGNHFRRWIISWANPHMITTAFFIIRVTSNWNSVKSVLLLEKTISCIFSSEWSSGVGGITESYTTVNGNTVEFRVGNLHYDLNSDSFQIEIVSNLPSSNNEPYIDFTGYKHATETQLVVLEPSISSPEIIEGWPSWAGNRTTIPRIQSNGTNVLLVGDTITNVAIGSTAGKPLITTTNGVVTTGAFGTSSGQFAEGNTVGKVTATEKTDNAEYKLLATASASPTSGALTEAVYDTGITMNPSTNTLTANLSGIATYAKALDPQMILNTTLYKVPVISADKEVRWSGAPGASGSTTELTYDNTDSKNLLSVNVTGYATSLEHAFAGSTVNETPIINVSGSTDGFKLTYGATTADLGITKLYTTDDANAKLSFGNMVSSTYKEALVITNGSATVTGSLSGNASTATSAGKLTTARKSYVDLGTASTTSTFDWSGDTVLPINGTLAVGHGGTGKTSVTANNFLVGNGTSALVEKTPAQVLSLIDAVSSSSLANVAFSGEYSSLSNKPSLTNDYIILDANTTIYVSINYIFNSVKKVGSLLTNVHMKGGTYSAWNNDSIEVLHSIGSDVYGTFNITNHILSYTLKSDIEFSYYLSSYGTLILKLKNNTNNDYRVSVSATVLDSSDTYPDFYKITEIDADTTAIAQSGTATNVWCNHALVSEKIGKTNSATTGIDYTSKGNTSTAIYLDNGEFKECTGIAAPYEWVTAFPSTYTAGKVYLL